MYYTYIDFPSVRQVVWTVYFYIIFGTISISFKFSIEGDLLLICSDFFFEKKKYIRGRSDVQKKRQCIENGQTSLNFRFGNSSFKQNKKL